MQPSIKHHQYSTLGRWFVALLWCASLTACSSDVTLQEEDVYDDHIPMVFGNSFSQAESEVTRGSSALQAGFKVGTWKRFGQPGQQLVMDGYKVDYNATATPYQWNYVDVNNQLQRYWDLGAFPYEFRAVSPYLPEAVISDTELDIQLSGDGFVSQTLIDGSRNITNAQGEPCVVAHVRRQKENAKYADYDCIKHVEINAGAKANAVREVHMPFHHLISKVGFRLYIDDPQPTSPDYKVLLKDVRISVVNSDNDFITASKRYSATNHQGLGNGTFSDNTTATGEHILIKHDVYAGSNLRENLNRESAFDLSPDYLQQIPQGNIQIHVQMTLQTDHYNAAGEVDETKAFRHDTVLRLNDSSLFTWAPNTRYIYYLSIPNLHEHQIFLDTCEVLPWDEIQTSDIPVEL